MAEKDDRLIDKLIKDIETEVGVAQDSGVSPSIETDYPAIKRLSKKYPEMNINPEYGKKIIIHTRSYLKAKNN